MSEVGPGSDQHGTVVLLHGFGGMPVMNQPLARMLRRAGFDTRLWGYDSWGRSLETICDRLGPKLVGLAAETPGPLHIVAHSMGGLVARALIHRQRPDNLGHVVMLGTPNAGSEVADFVMRWPIARPILGQAAPALVTRRTAAMAGLLGPIDYSVGVIAGNRQLPGSALARLIPGPNDGKVSVASCHVAEATDCIILPLSHSFLLYDGAAHRQVRHFLLRGRFARPEMERV